MKKFPKMLDSTSSAYKFSLFKNIYSKDKPDLNIGIDDLYKITKEGFFKDEINNLRKTYNQQAYTKQKQKIQAVTISGIFDKYEVNSIVKHSGLIQLELFNVKFNTTTFSNICNDEYTFLAFKNADGNKISLIVKIKPSLETHKSQFLALKNYYHKKYDLDINTKNKDVSKAMILSYDPNIYINKNAKQFNELCHFEEELKEQQPQSKNNLHIVYSKSEEEKKVCQIIDILRKQNINLLDSNTKKLEIGYSISNTFDEKGRAYFHQISNINKNYNPKETDIFYSKLLLKKNHISLSTFIHYAKQAGVILNRDTTPNNINKNRLFYLYQKLKTRRLEISRKFNNQTSHL